MMSFNNQSTAEFIETLQGTEIAIIGMACRVPGATTVAQFWQNLRNGVESITFFSPAELLAAGCDPALIQDPHYVPANGCIADPDLFDAAFFGFTPREAQLLDPQQRLFLEAAAEALENAGYGADAYRGLVGVYAGCGFSTYLLDQLAPNDDLMQKDGYQIVIATGHDFLPTRVSYKLNLCGPSVNVQTACSTSLVAVHLACQSLLEGDCDLALAGGVSVPFPQTNGYLYQTDMIASADGHCRAFDAQASGTVGGSGLGIVVLRRLADALAAGDTIYAVIKGSAINNDGAQKVGFTAPSVTGQAQVISNAQASAGVDPATITYVEAHGTGTKLGDPVEIAALTQAFRRQTGKQQYCALGSLKTNVGHLDTAAGVAGLIKTTLALYHKQLPPSLHFTTPNPQIDFANTPFYVNTQLTDWPTNGSPRRAGVSSFGIGGTNAHVVLEEAPRREPSGASRPWQLLLLSAKSPDALAQATINLAAHLQEQPDLPLADVAYTLAVGRHHHPYRKLVVCQSVDDAIHHLKGENSPGRLYANFCATEKRPVAFMFPGQGAQYVNMGRELYEREPSFRQAVDDCAKILQPHLGLDLRDLLYPKPEHTTESAQQLDQTANTQPALFVIAYALAQLWRSWGVQPQALIGHSIGEYVAATLAGVLSLPDALKLVAIRGRLMQSLPTGAMLAVSLPQAELAARLRSGQALENALTLAAINGPDRCVVSGPSAAIAAYQQQLTEQGIACRRLHTSHAFHSAMMDSILAAFTEQVKAVKLHPPQIPYLSNVTGMWICAEEATDPAYWAKQLRQPVDFAGGLETLLKEPDLILLEIGPGRTLSMLATPYARQQQTVLWSLPHPHEAQSDVAFLLAMLGKFWAAGGSVDWSGFYAQEQRHRLPLPTYPFERKRYWIEAVHTAAKPATPKQAPFQRRAMDDWFYTPSWKHVPLLRRTLPDAGTWLLCLDETGLGEQLAEQLRQAQQRVITVRCGAGFAQPAADTFVIDPTQRADYSKLWQALATTLQKPLQKIVHLWNVADKPDTTLTTSFYSLLYLAQAIGEQHVTEALALFIVANQLVNVTGSDVVQPTKATLLGPTYVLPCEYKNITCRAIDVAWPANGATAAQLLIEFASDLDAPTGEKSIVAYRGGRRWLSSIEPLRLPAASTPVQHGGVYLITGGLGGIGLSLAEALASWQPKLVLWSRSPLPASSTWPTWLAGHPADDPTSQKIRCLQRIEAQGGTVLVQAVDVADAVAVQTALAVATAQVGPLQGVIHSAGIGGDNLIHQTDYAATQAVLAPKVAGALNLQAALGQRPLDFFVVCSSLNAVVGSPGQVAYTAANAFLDAFAQRLASAYPVLSINWDGWREVGMAANQFTAADTETGLTPAEGCQVFFRALGSGLPQLLVCTHAFNELPQRFAAAQHTTPTSAGSQQSRPQLSVAYASPQTPAEQWLAAIWQAHIGIEPIGRDDDFFAHLAGDSLNGLGLLNRIQDSLGEILHLQAIFEAPTIGQMANYLQTHYAARMTQLGLATPRITAESSSGVNDKAAQTTAPALLSTATIAQVRHVLATGLPTFVKATTKLKPAIFILSPPRSGSTLLRVMLAGHPQLFAPPELGILLANTLRDEAVQSGDAAADWQGLTRALMQIQAIDVQAARQKMDQFRREELPIEQIYAYVQAQLNGRLLVDKTPTYAFALPVLRRAEELFDGARYIHLLRHPYGMIRSFEEARMDLIGPLPTQALDSKLTRRTLAEALWLICNENIQAFLQNVPAQRQHQLKFEELVAQPQTTLAQLCQFLQIDFHDGLLAPYQDAEQRMTDGIYQTGRMIGDPKFHQHTGIRAEVATQWRDAYRADFLSPPTWALAEAFGYTERAQTPAHSAPSLAAFRKATPDPRTLLKQIDQLSEAEIDAALAALAGEQV